MLRSTGLWHPQIEINNNINLEALLDADMSVCRAEELVNDLRNPVAHIFPACLQWNFKDAATGLMGYTQRYRGEIVCESHLADFPFDFVDVRINVGPKLFKKDKVVMVRSTTTDPTHNIVMNTSLPEWGLVPVAPFTTELETATNYTNLTFSFMLERRYGYYLWKVVFSQLMLAMLSWTMCVTPCSVAYPQLY